MTPPGAPCIGAAQVFAEGGEFGAFLAGIDWAATPLGPPETWPTPLVTALRFMLLSKKGMLLLWGTEAVMLYNESYIPVPGSKHPWALGRPFSEVFPEVWDDLVSSHFSYVTSACKPLLIPDEPSLLERHGFLEQCYFDVSFQPVLRDGTVDGVLIIITETTGRVLGERRLRLLSEIGTRTVGLRGPGEVARVVAQVVGAYQEDVPLMCLYLAAGPGVLRLAACTGLSAERPSADVPPQHRQHSRLRQVPETLSLRAAEGESVPAWLATVVAEGVPATLSAAAFADQVEPDSEGRPPVEQVLALPLSCTGRVEGVLVVGVNPRFPLAEAYHGFLDVLAAAVAGALAAALAHDEQRRRADALAELDRAKTTFFASVSHEFRTPLTLMLGPMQEALAEEDRPERREQLKLVERNAARLLKLVNTLLDVARAEAGRICPDLEQVDLARVTAELAGVFRSSFATAGLTLVADCPPLHRPVAVDREMWEQVVLNLLSNALKFTFTGGVRVSVTAAGEQARLTVADTGTGIPEHEIPHLFERFHQVRGARSRSHEGSGLGLVLVKDLVEAHGGTIAIDSRLDQGTTITVDLPFVPQSLSRPPSADAAFASDDGPSSRSRAYVEEARSWLATGPADEALPAVRAPCGVTPLTGRPRLLVVDDNADMRAYLAQLLRPDYDLLLATDGEAALETARTHPVELVLTDVMMPRLDGFGLVRELRADPCTARLPIIMLTARADEEALVEGRHAGADDYLAKPFSARQLLARVRTGLELSRLREQVLAETRDQLALLASLAEAGLRLSATLEPGQVLHTAGELLVPDLAAQISIHLVDQVASGKAPALPAYTAGTPLLAPRLLADAAAPALCGAALEDPDPTVVALPLRARDHLLGALVAARPTAAYTEVERTYLENIAHRLALAYDNATRYHAERRLALALQRSLLPQKLPQPPGVRLATHYHASTHGAEVGGDWYDVLALPDGAVGLVIGDVMGHDVEAATMMGQLRTALHGFALEGAAPAQVLARVDAYLRALDTDRFATCLYATYHPGSRRLRYAASGHPPPLLVQGEHTDYLEVPPALPLGLGSSPADREVVVPSGAGLLLYTDGLVEQHRQPLETGLTAVHKACAALPTPARPQQLIEQALTLLGPLDQVDDDTALLAAITDSTDPTNAPQTDRG
ncbi:MAG: SpoIIE family protein phosphatase [Streptomycetaceae bacterium]|nr:SpoIIE family protein phosphatase [Streptomycetaceae bacterium]